MTRHTSLKLGLDVTQDHCNFLLVVCNNSLYLVRFKSPNFVKFGIVVFETCERTDRQIDRQTKSCISRRNRKYATLLLPFNAQNEVHSIKMSVPYLV